MTDKELIELAAKAYGFGDQDGNFIWTESEYPRGSKTNGALWNYMGWCDTAQLWNPLTDDGDALRLAVKLCIDVSHDAIGMKSFVYVRTVFNDERHIGLSEIFDDEIERLERTRRAITRAAAQIGKEME